MTARHLFAAFLLFLAPFAFGADHNDPNSINSIFGDVPVNAADLYDMFGWPSDDGKNVILALTFAPVPSTGVFDQNLMYRIHVDPDPRAGRREGDNSLQAIIHYADGLKAKYNNFKPYEIRVTFNARNQAKVQFLGFPGGAMSKLIEADEIYTIASPKGHRIKLFVGGRDDAFFNDLPGFFRSINYAPEFYNVPVADEANRELRIPKTLLQLEGNDIFNNTPPPTRPKAKLPPGPYTWKGTRFLKDANGNYRFVYSGKDAQAGRNINAIILEIPLAYLTNNTTRDRIVNAWGESWVRKGRTPGDTPSSFRRVDTDGLPFSDAGLSERLDSRQLGANNLILSRTFVRRFGHLGWGFGPSITALGLPTCFDHDNAPVSKLVFYDLATVAFPRVKKCLFQELNMPDNSWNKHNLPIKLKRPFEVFIPNVNAIDMDTTGSWPFGRRLEDQVATRFLSVFLDHSAMCGAKKCGLETLGDQALWNAAPITPKTPPNPLKNDKPFLTVFPYLADPW